VKKFHNDAPSGQIHKLVTCSDFYTCLIKPSFLGMVIYMDQMGFDEIICCQSGHLETRHPACSISPRAKLHVDILQCNLAAS
jgi:hypothetical protein